MLCLLTILPTCPPLHLFGFGSIDLMLLLSVYTCRRSTDTHLDIARWCSDADDKLRQVILQSHWKSLRTVRLRSVFDVTVWRRPWFPLYRSSSPRRHRRFRGPGATDHRAWSPKRSAAVAVPRHFRIISGSCSFRRWWCWTLTLPIHCRRTMTVSDIPICCCRSCCRFFLDSRNVRRCVSRGWTSMARLLVHRAVRRRTPSTVAWVHPAAAIDDSCLLLRWTFLARTGHGTASYGAGRRRRRLASWTESDLIVLLSFGFRRRHRSTEVPCALTTCSVELCRWRSRTATFSLTVLVVLFHCISCIVDWLDCIIRCISWSFSLHSCRPSILCAIDLAILWWPKYTSCPEPVLFQLLNGTH